ncbi:MAG: thiamine diphosphokinase [Pseudomonadota bacterium]
MTELPLQFDRPVTLAGGGVLSSAQLKAALRIAPTLIAADGAADRVKELGSSPDFIIGDLDSVEDAERWRGRSASVIHLTEQDSTDFEKSLYATTAPLYICVGFTGARVDHTLAVFHAMLRYPKKSVILLGEADAIALLPPGRRIRFGLPIGTRFSIFPLLPTRAVWSTGLEWPVDQLEFATGTTIGTSNRTSAPECGIEMASPGALLMLPPEHVAELIDALKVD